MNLVEKILKEGIPGDEQRYSGLDIKQFDFKGEGKINDIFLNFYRIEYKNTHNSPFRFPKELYNKLPEWDKKVIDGSLICLNSQLIPHKYNQLPKGYLFGFTNKRFFKKYLGDWVPLLIEIGFKINRYKTNQYHLISNEEGIFKPPLTNEEKEIYYV